MAKRDPRTTAGGRGGLFQSTRWSQIRGARTSNEERRRVAVNNLLQRYWRPIYCYLRRRGRSSEQAKDLTQGFFCEVVLGRELIQQADETRGRFRTFLLTSLDNYVTSVHRKEAARKRLPPKKLEQLECGDPPDSTVAFSSTSPEAAFCYAWATALLDQVLAQVKEEYCGTGRKAYWQIFRAKVVSPIMQGADSPPLEALCRQYGIETEKRASNMMITVKRRFAAVLRNRLRQHVRSDAEVEDEFRDLMQSLAEAAAI